MTVVDGCSVQSTIFHEAILQGEYESREASVGTQRLEDWDRTSDPVAHFDMQIDLATASMKLALSQLHTEHKVNSNELDIIKAPPANKGVYALRHYTKGSFVLVPITKTVAWKKAGEPTPDMQLALNLVVTDKGGKEHKAYLCKTDIEAAKAKHTDHKEADRPGFIAPFWRVNPTPDEKSANVHIVLFRVPVVVGGGNPTMIEIPCFQNLRPVKNGDQILYHKPKVTAARTVVSAKTPAAKAPAGRGRPLPRPMLLRRSRVDARACIINLAGMEAECSSF